MEAHTTSEGSGPRPSSVLLVETDRSTVESLTFCLNERGVLVSIEPSGPAALDHLGAGSFDCLVVDPAVDGLDVDQFVTALRSTPGRCPVVWLPRSGGEPIADDALDVPTTIVEQGSVGEDCSFLVEKIRGIIDTESPRGGDRSTFETLVESASDGLYTLDAAGRVTYLNES